MSPTRRRFGAAAILSLAFLLPVMIARLAGDQPQVRRVHVDLFRYGNQPEVIHVGRGDTLVLTFSARDTPHSFFLQEYGVDVKVSPLTNEVQVVTPDAPADPAETRREVVLKIGRPGLAGLLGIKARFRCHVYCGQMHAFEQGFLVEHPNGLRAGATGVLVAIPLVALLGLRRPRENTHPTVSDVLDRWPFLRRLVAVQGLPFWLMTGMSLALYVVLLTSLLGTQMAGGNLGVLLLWVVWLFALIVVLVPLGGRLWCTLCPIPMLGDALQRGATVDVLPGNRGPYGNRLRGLMRRWPAALSDARPRTLVFLAFGTVSILIVSQPRWTGWAVLILLLLATIMPLIFELRAFCRFLCPVGAFLSAYAPMGRLGLRALRADVCQRCGDEGRETCRKGNERGWACPYGLTVGHIQDNADCGLCLECLRSCSFNNVTLVWRRFGLERFLHGRDQALQASVLLTLAVAYCLVFMGPWHSLRDMIDIVDKKNWDLFAVYSAVLWLTALGLVPLLIRLLTVLGTRMARVDTAARDLYPANASPLVPMGLWVWIAFAVPMLMVEWSFVLSTLSDPFGWGWNLFGTAGRPWIQLWPHLVPVIQAAAVALGFGLSLTTAFRVWSAVAASPRQAALGTLPIGGFLLALGLGLIWFFT